MTTMPDSILEVEGVSVQYGGVKAVSDASLRVMKGELVAVLGPNGAGKTSLLRAISGAVPPNRGTIRIGGKEATRRRPDQILRLGCAHVLEGRHIFGPMTVEENLRLGATIRDDPDGVEADLTRLYESFPILNEKRHQHGMFLSGGQQQLLAICRALLSRPRILLLDEPSLGLAPVMLEGVANAIAWAHQELGASVLIVEQHTAMALALTQRCYVMVRGRVVLEAPSEDLVDGRILEQVYLGAGAAVLA
jgi:branched-chain amino acid transport system ATP-binding protein